jgi:hypothetical protein
MLQFTGGVGHKSIPSVRKLPLLPFRCGKAAGYGRLVSSVFSYSPLRYTQCWQHKPEFAVSTTETTMYN